MELVKLTSVKVFINATHFNFWEERSEPDTLVKSEVSINPSTIVSMRSTSLYYASALFPYKKIVLRKTWVPGKYVGRLSKKVWVDGHDEEIGKEVVTRYKPFMENLPITEITFVNKESIHVMEEKSSIEKLLKALK